MLSKITDFKISDGFEKLYPQKLSRGHKIASWNENPSSELSTTCIVVGKEYWIYQSKFGAIRFNEANNDIVAYPDSRVDLDWFQYWAKHSWLPLVYQFWGRQVLHSSAAVYISSGDVIAFVGDNEAGKSTIAYGLGQRDGWQQIYDDTLSFTVDKGRINIHYLPNVVRLRPESAKYYNQNTYGHGSINWPDIPMKLKHIYILGKKGGSGVPGKIKSKKFVDAYQALLENAYTLTLNLANQNQRLLTDYLTLARKVPVSSISNSKNIEGIEEVLDAIENHAT